LPGGGEAHRHRLVALVLDKPGVLNRVSSLMRARNFNIDSLAVSHTDQPDVSRMTITLHGDDVAVEQAAKQLYRLIDVLKVQDVTSDPTIEHELALVKIRATDGTRGEILKLVESDAISAGHARALLSLPSAAQQLAAAELVLKHRWSVRETEDWVRARVSGAPRSKSAPTPQADPDTLALEDEFRRALGTKVILTRLRKGGRLTIEFYSDDELEGLRQRLSRP